MKTRTFTTIALLSVLAVRVMAQGNVIMKEGTVDADKWPITDGTTAVTPGTTAVAEGATVTLHYTGAKRVKSVRAIKQIPSTSVVYMKWDANQKKLMETSTLGFITEVTTTATDISWPAGTYVVNEDATINGNVTVNGDIHLIVCDGATLTLNGRMKDAEEGVHELNIYCQSEQTGTVVAGNAAAAVFEDLRRLNIHGVQVTAVSSCADAAGIRNVNRVDLYGGSLTARNTTSGSAILLDGAGSELNVYGGVVTADGKGSFPAIGSAESGTAAITLYDGKFYASSPSDQALSHVTIGKDAAFVGMLYDSQDNATWTPLASSTSSKKYVKAEFLTDLSTINGDYTAKNGETLTGTLTAEVKITIAAGATVTLSGVSINDDGEFVDGECAGISCAGDATIILAAGTTNICRGFYEDYPGVYIAENSTLTIKGEGTLIASPYDGGTEESYGAGIGGGYEISCGNIRIEGGTIVATGGNSAAGIGACSSTDGEDGSCGDITIVGGTVTAAGGVYAAGIGGGNGSSCGKITIKKTVTKVTATAGEEASNSIGEGETGSCDGVDIEAGANVIQN